MKIENYYLNLEKINSLVSKQEREQIHRYYMDFLHLSSEGRDPIAKSIFLTLIKSGYLIDSREEKLHKILEESNEV